MTLPKRRYDHRISFINNHPIIGNYNNIQVAGGILSQYLIYYAKYWAAMLKGENKADFIKYPLIYRLIN